MNDQNILDIPVLHAAIEAKSKEIGFTMPSDLDIGTLLKTLMSSKPSGNFLELGTGTGLSLSWMIDGMDAGSTLVSVDNDPKLIEIVKGFFGKIENVELVCADGADWIMSYQGDKFDLVFADAWPGKYSQLDEVLELIKVGGMYVIDDMSPQENWPDGHAEKAEKLVAYLESREDLTLTKMNWSTGVIVAAKRG